MSSDESCFLPRHTKDRRLLAQKVSVSHITSDSSTSQYTIHKQHHHTTSTMAIFPLALPPSGNSNAAGITTSSTTATSGSAEALPNNAIVNGEGAADSSADELFGGDVDFSDHGSLFGDDSQGAEDSTTVAAANASEIPEAPRNSVIPAGQNTADNSPFEGYIAPGFNDDLVGAGFEGDDDLFAGPAASQPAAPGRQPRSPMPFNLPQPGADWQDLERAGIANGALADNAPANGAPAKRPRGRPPGKAPPKAPVFYRCRYGCTKGDGKTFKGDRALRKHMMRVHCLFSAAHTDLVVCRWCGRTCDPKVKELICNKRSRACPPLTEKERADISVIAPRDAQEEADTFAYTHSGPNGEGPSRLVIVQEGDDEVGYKHMNTAAMNSWTAAGTAQLNHGLLTPDEKPSPPNGQAIVDPTSGDVYVPATPCPTYQGKSKKRAVDSPVEEQPTPKRVMHGALPEPALEAFDKATDLLAQHQLDFPEEDFSGVQGLGFLSDETVSQETVSAAAKTFDDFVLGMEL